MRIIGWIAAFAAAATLIACAAAGPEQTGKQPAVAPTALAPAPKALTISDASFGCIRDLKPVRGFFVGNLLGYVDATVAAANAGGAKPYPPGSVVQLVPTEVMVKHPAGYNAATNDWEFFELDVQPGVNKIRVRGSTEVVNQFGGSKTEPPKFTRGYGLAFGHSERKAMAMSLVDRALRAQELGEEVTAPAQMPEFVMSHSDSLESSGFVQHLKLPHYVDFQSELELVRKMRKAIARQDTGAVPDVEDGAHA